MGCNLGVCFSQNCQIRQSQQGTKMAWISSIKKASTAQWGSDFACHWGSKKFDVYHLFFLSITLLNSKVCAKHSETVLMSLDGRRFVVVQPHSTWSLCNQVASQQNSEFESMVNLGGLLLPKKFADQGVKFGMVEQGPVSRAIFNP